MVNYVFFSGEGCAGLTDIAMRIKDFPELAKVSSLMALAKFF
jgi:hypothetical protein